MAPKSTCAPPPPLANPRQRANDARMLVRTATTLALLLASLPAQQGKPDLRETLDGQLLETLLPKLASDEPRDVAWGAHLVGHYRLEGATEALRAALRRFRDLEGEPARQVRLHLIDALLVLEVKLPKDEFVFLLDDPLTRVPAFLCAAQDVRGHAEVLAELAKTGFGRSDIVPFAAGGLLVDAAKLDDKPATFARHLLTLARANLHVSVRDAKPDHGQWNSAIGLGGLPGYYPLLRGFPRMPHHTLRQGGIDTSTTRVVRKGVGAEEAIWSKRVDGPVPPAPGGRFVDSAVTHKRELVRGIPREALAKEPNPQPLTHSTAARWLERMAKHSLPSRGYSQDVQFSDVTTLSKDVQRLHAELQAYGNGLIEDLIEEGWLPQGEPTTFVMPIDVTVHDSRGDQSIPLPSIDELLGRPAPTPQTSPR